MSAGASPAPDPTGELTALPQTPSWFQGGHLRQEGNGGKDYEEGGREGKGEWGREGKRGKLGGLAP